MVLTVPLALAGGVLGAVTFQPLDLLTMIGFIMMIGIIVNHAILLVDLTRDAMNHGHSLEQALRMSLNQHLRAMVASTLTGALGALVDAVKPAMDLPVKVAANKRKPAYAPSSRWAKHARASSSCA